MTAPRFSIITVVRNNADGLQRTALTLRDQSCTDWEWIVVDGASTDGTVTVIESLRPMIARAVSEKDLGIYDAMNKGLRLACGDYVIFMNSGDVFITSDCLARLAEFLERQPIKPDLALCDSDLRMAGGLLVARPAKQCSYIWHALPAMHQAIAFGRQAHLGVPYDLRYRVSADYYAVARMIANGAKCANTGIPVSINELGGDSFSYRYFWKHAADSWNIQRDVLKTSLPSRILSFCRRCVMRLLVSLLSLRPFGYIQSAARPKT